MVFIIVTIYDVHTNRDKIKKLIKITGSGDYQLNLKKPIGEARNTEDALYTRSFYSNLTTVVLPF